MNSTALGLRELACEAMNAITGLPAVAVCLDGENLVAAFEIDMLEHERRATLRAGAVTSRSLLHGLWLLPAGIPVPVSALPAVKQQRLRDAHHFALEGASGFERTYEPAGRVRAVAFTGADVKRSVAQAIRFSPVVQRVVVTRPGARVSHPARELAAEFGIGIVEGSASAPTLSERPKPAVVGVPAVYRWWIAEVAYESWLQQNAQPVSCDLGFSGPLNPASP